MIVRRRKITAALFAVYTAAMLYLLFFGRLVRYDPLPYGEHIERYTNFIPLQTLERFMRLLTNRAVSPALVRSALINLAGNVILFIPVGLFLPSVFERQKNVFVFMFTALLCFAAAEGLQLALRLGSCDVDDVILNFAGALIGFITAKVIRMKKEGK